jgi:hypothetical protein
MSWTIDIGPGGHPRMPNLPDRASVRGLPAPVRKLWERFDALARQHADLAAERARIEAVAIPEAEAAQHEHAVEAVRAGRPVELGPDPAALRERAQRLAVEADATEASTSLTMFSCRRRSRDSNSRATLVLATTSE